MLHEDFFLSCAHWRGNGPSPLGIIAAHFTSSSHHVYICFCMLHLMSYHLCLMFHHLYTSYLMFCSSIFHIRCIIIHALMYCHSCMHIWCFIIHIFLVRCFIIHFRLYHVSTCFILHIWCVTIYVLMYCHPYICYLMFYHPYISYLMCCHYPLSSWCIVICSLVFYHPTLLFLIHLLSVQGISIWCSSDARSFVWCLEVHLRRFLTLCDEVFNSMFSYLIYFDLVVLFGLLFGLLIGYIPIHKLVSPFPYGL